MKDKPDISSLSRNQLIQYIWDYYKIPILVGIFLLYSLVSYTYKTVTAKEPILEVIMVNSTSSYEGDMGSNEFVSQQGLDPEEYEIHANTSFRLYMDEKHMQDDYSIIQTLIATLIEGDIDVFGGTPQVFSDFAMEGYFADLRDYYSAEELEAYESILVYTTERDSGKTYPCGFSLGSSAWNERFYYFNGDCQFGIMYNADDPETAKDFLTYALTY